MSVSIRLRREGAKNRPYYKIAVADQRKPRDGKFIELIGTYDPLQKDRNSSIDLDRVDYWMKCGAKPSDTVRTIINTERRRRLIADKATETGVAA